MFNKRFIESPQTYWEYSNFCKPMRLNRLLLKDVFYYILLKRIGEGQMRREKAVYRLNSTLTSICDMLAYFSRAWC